MDMNTNISLRENEFESIWNPSHIDLFLISNSSSSQNTKTVSAHLSDFIP